MLAGLDGEEAPMRMKQEPCMNNLQVLFVGDGHVGVDDQDDDNDNLDDKVVLRNGSLRTRSLGSPCSQCWLQFRFELTYFCLVFNTHWLSGIACCRISPSGDVRWHCRLHPPKSQSPQEAQVKMMVIEFTAGWW